MSGKKQPKKKGYFQIFSENEKDFKGMPMTPSKAAKLGCGASTQSVSHPAVWVVDHPAAGPLMDELVDALVYAKCQLKGPEEAAGQSVMTLRSVVKSETQKFQTSVPATPAAPAASSTQEDPSAAATIQAAALDPEKMKSIIESMIRNQETGTSKVAKADKDSLNDALEMVKAYAKQKRKLTSEELEKIMKRLERNVSITIEGLRRMFERLVADKTLTQQDVDIVEAALLKKVVDGSIVMEDVRNALKEYTWSKKTQKAGDR